MEEQNASLEKLISEVDRPLWRAAAEARLSELRAEVERLKKAINDLISANMRPYEERDRLLLQVDGLQKVFRAACGLRDHGIDLHRGTHAEILWHAIAEYEMRTNRETCRAPLPGGTRCVFFMPCPDHGGREDLSRACKVHNNLDCEMCAEKPKCERDTDGDGNCYVHPTGCPGVAQKRKCESCAGTGVALSDNLSCQKCDGGGFQ